MKKILFSGYYGFGNTGDEAVLSATLDQLALTHPGVEVTVLSASPLATMREHNVKSVARMKPYAVLQAILASDLVVSGGGGLLQDVTSQRSLFYYLSILALAKSLGKPTVLYGQGFGPINSSFAKTITRPVLDRVNAIGVRDACSGQEIAQLGVKRPIEVSADPALLLQPEFSPVVERALSGYQGLAPKVALCLRPWAPRKQMVTLGIELVESLSRLDMKVVLVPMQLSQDLPLLREIAEAAQSQASLVQDRLSPKEILAFLGAMDVVVGMRLHSLIFSCVSGVPCVGLVYDPKVKSFLDEVGQPALPLEGVTSASVVHACQSVLSCSDRDRVSSNVEVLKKRAQTGLRVIRRYI